MNKIETIDVVSKDQNNSESLIVFEINEITSIVGRTSVGQFIKSQPFELTYRSIGKSKWTVILFPNGQYEAGGISNESICVYLKLVQCEQQSMVFKFDVRFQLGSDKNATVTKIDQSVCFDNVKQRWIGTNLMRINEMIINGSRFIQDDTLLLSVHVNEHLTKNVLAETPPTTFYNNNYMMETESYAQSCDDIKSINVPAIPSPPSREKYSNLSNNGVVFDMYHNNLLQPSYDTSESTNLTGRLVNNKTRTYDNNLNYVENEYSDDEDNTKKSTNLKSGWIGNIFSGIKHYFKESDPK